MVRDRIESKHESKSRGGGVSAKRKRKKKRHNGMHTATSKQAKQEARGKKLYVKEGCDPSEWDVWMWIESGATKNTTLGGIHRFPFRILSRSHGGAMCGVTAHSQSSYYLMNMAVQINVTLGSSNSYSSGGNTY